MLSICAKFYWNPSTKYGRYHVLQNRCGQMDDGRTDSLKTYCLCHGFFDDGHRKSFDKTLSAALYFEWPDRMAGLEIISVMRTSLLVNLVTVIVTVNWKSTGMSRQYDVFTVLAGWHELCASAAVVMLSTSVLRRSCRNWLSLLKSGESWSVVFIFCSLPIEYGSILSLH